MQKVAGYVYIMASRIGGTLYTGVTSDLPSRSFSTDRLKSKASPRHTKWTASFTSRFMTASRGQSFESGR